MTQEIDLSHQLRRRGEPSATEPSLVFLRYKRGKEVWVPKEQLERVKAQAKVVNAKQRKKPEHKERMKVYFQTYNQLPRSREYRQKYWSQPHILERRNQQWATDPELRQKALIYNRTDGRVAARRAYRQANKEAINEYRREHQKQKIKSNPLFRIAKNCRSRIRDAVTEQGVHKASKSKILLGCEFDFFRGYIEAQFERGMSWQNWGVFWQIDHKIPIASFNLLDPEQQFKAFHYSNCQPLWKDINLTKSDKMPDQETRGRHVRQQLN